MQKKIFLPFIPYIMGILTTVMMCFCFVHFYLLDFRVTKNLFEEIGVYSFLKERIDQGKDEIIALLDENLTNSQKQTLESALETAFTAENIQTQVDDILFELTLFMKDKTSSLPNFYIARILPSQLDATILESIPSVLNSKTLLSYFNQNEIIYSLQAFKLLYFALYILFLVSSILLFILLITTILLHDNFRDVFKILMRAFIIPGISFIFIAILVLVLTPKIPTSFLFMRFITLTRPSILNAYLQTLLYQSTYILFFIALFFILLALLLQLGFFKKQRPYSIRQKKYFFYALIFLLMLSIYNIGGFVKMKNLRNQYLATYTTVFFNIPITQVIPAEKDGIYIVELQILDKETGQPLPDISFELIGKHLNTKKDSKWTGKTKENEQYSQELTKGTYRLRLIEDEVTQFYHLPAPYYFEIVNAGTFSITLSLEEKKIVKPEGIAQIQIFGPNYEPIENIDLKLSTPPIYVDSIATTFELHSISNQKGVCVFKAPIGMYTVEVSLAELSDRFLPKEPFQIEIVENTPKQYTVYLEETT